MILASTIRKLATAKATIYKLSIAAHTIEMPTGEKINIEPWNEYFATQAQAKKRIELYSLPGVKTPYIIKAELCSMGEHYMRT